MNEPELRIFGETDLDREFRRFCEIWSLEQPGDTKVARLLQAIGDPLYAAEFGVGFLEGVMDGGGARLRAWRDDLQSTVRALVRFIKDDGLLLLPVGGAVSLYEFFRTDFDPKTSGALSLPVESALERLKIIHDYQPIFLMLDILNDKVRTTSLLQLFNVAGQDLWDMVKATGWSWARRFLIATGDAAKQGRMFGEIVGAAVIELARAFIEPPELSMAELIGAFGLGQDEVADLAAEG